MAARNRDFLWAAVFLSTTSLACQAAPAQTPQASAPTVQVRPSSEIEPVWRRIRTFGGDVHERWRRIRTFGGGAPTQIDLENFWGVQQAPPDWAALTVFQGQLSERWRRIRTFWDTAGNSKLGSDLRTVATNLDELISYSQANFGAVVQARTGQDFRSGFADPLLTRFGIDLKDPNSLAKLDESTREEFFLTWFDNLMQYSGADQVDHWMSEVRWSPALTQTLGTGRDATIGILDFTLTGEDSRNVVTSGGVSTFTNGHGSAVASLMIAPHDGRGVMGIAPNASVIAYNPFDSSGTADWPDVAAGITMLTNNGASIVNLSLGVPGWTLHPGWNEVFRQNDVKKAADHTFFVFAAGNEGVTQTQDLLWDVGKTPPFVVVGSVDPNLKISDFSNRPGTACLKHKEDKCREGDRLMDRFIVAPGEFILVSDGQGGVMRASGTSFAAPLVSGTVALIHDRWPWLADRPDDAAEIILRSARDLGEPGTDPVYGVGLLDVEAALSPLSFDKLKWYEGRGNKLKAMKAEDIRKKPQQERNAWEADGVYFYVFEDTLKSHRDFAIPLSTRLLGQNVSTKDLQEQFAGYLRSRFNDWLNRPAGTGFTQFGSQGSFLVGGGDRLQASLMMAPRQQRFGFRSSDVPFETALRLDDVKGRWSFSAGEGEGAAVVGGTASFALASDFAPETGGVNPALGYASGGAFSRFDYRLTKRARVSFGFSERKSIRDFESMSWDEKDYFSGFDDYEASATTVDVAVQAAPALSLRAGYTRLSEKNAVLGIQSLEPTDFLHGSTTEAVTVGAELSLSAKTRLGLSAMGGRTHTPGGADQSIRVSDNGMLSSAFQVGLTTADFMRRGDRLQLSLAQPLHLERNIIEFTSVQVVDRNTGEIGEVTQRFDLPSKQRRLVGEMLYASPLGCDGCELSLFGRAQLKGEKAADRADLIAGARLTLAF